MSNSLWPHGLQHARTPCPSPTPGVCPNSCLLSRSCYSAISSSIVPSPPAFNLSQHQGLFQWVSSSYQVAQVLEFQLQHQSSPWIFRTDFLCNRLVGSPCSPRDSQESSLAPQFKSINSLTLSFLYGPTLTSIHDRWKNHSFDWTDHSGLRWTSGVVVSLLKWKSSHAILPRPCGDSPLDPGNKPRSLQSGCPAGTYNTFSIPAGPAPLSSLTTVTSL